MTSLINFAAINENFPVAGQDNDTQVFRDNFDTIKTSLRVAKEEITDLQDNVARTDSDNDFNSNIITNAKFINNVDTVLSAGTVINPVETIDYQNGNYQIFTIASTSVAVSLLNFPSDGDSVGKVTIELYSNNNVSKTVSFLLSGSGASTVKSSGFPGVTSGNPILTLNSTTTAVIFEIWRNSESTFFMKYVGEFS